MSSKDASSADVTAKLIVNKYTDDGMLAPNDSQWNSRHQVIPSNFN